MTNWCNFVQLVLLFAGLFGPNFQGSEAAVVKRSSGDNNLPPECTEKFRALKNSTMCLHDSPDVLESGMTEEEKMFVLDLHNRLRAEVEPVATNMMKMIWDEKVAEVAQKWAKQCIVDHDANRRVPDYGIGIGQNAAGGQGTWESAVMGWYNEVNLFKYGEKPSSYLGKDGWKKIGHYTQVVQAGSVRLGCGFAKCSSSYRRYYICNYGPGQSNVAKPYKSGDERCSKCPNSCNDGLCDCGGKVCKNGGKLDINTCTCSCKELYSGDECEILNCPERDETSCWYSYPKGHCKYSNIKPKCPYMCGICGGPGAATPPPVIVTPFNCTYSGFQETAEKCATYGNKGLDTWACQSVGGKFGCSDCLKFSNVKTQYCPVMCGVCKAPCDGLTCKNGGKLDRENCKCNCKGLFKGVECEEAIKLPVIVTPFNCTYKGFQETEEKCATYGNKGLDTWACKSTGGKHYGCSDCVKYSNIKTQFCPVMCGICKAPCNGLTCKNGGKLDRENCKCDCPDLYKGDECEQVNCPDKDSWVCRTQWPPRYCKKYSNVPGRCPYMCGLCQKKE